MNKLILLIAAGTPVVTLDGNSGTLVDDTAVDFGEISLDILAQKFAQADRQDLLPLLTHREEGGQLVKYNPLGNRIEVTPEQEDALTEFEKVDDALEAGLAEHRIPDISDDLAEKVARSTDAITSPSELAEDLGVGVDELDDIAGSDVPPAASTEPSTPNVPEPGPAQQPEPANDPDTAPVAPADPNGPGTTDNVS